MKKEPVNLLNDLCKEALSEETQSDPHIVFLTRAPKGKTINQEATTITLNSRGNQLFHEIVTTLRKDTKLRVHLSISEVQQEVRGALFEGTDALENGTFDAEALVTRLFSRLEEGRGAWEVYLPITRLDLPDNQEIALAGGTFKSLTDAEKSVLRAKYKDVLAQAKWESPEKATVGVEKHIQRFDEVMNSSESWFYARVEGRENAAKNLAIESAQLGMDIFRFFSLLNGINPESCNLGFPNQAVTSLMRSFQLSKGQVTVNYETSGVVLSYSLDLTQYNKLTKLPAFQKVQAASNKLDPTQVEQKFLQGIQQYAEATRLPSATLKLVWYLSALETVLVKESEGTRNKKVERRVRKLLGDSASSLVNPLYDKRRKPVHYGHRNRISDELITDSDVATASTLAYLALLSALKQVNSHAAHDLFVNYLETLPWT